MQTKFCKESQNKDGKNLPREMKLYWKLLKSCTIKIMLKQNTTHQVNDKNIHTVYMYYRSTQFIYIILKRYPNNSQVFYN